MSSIRSPELYKRRGRRRPLFTNPKNAPLGRNASESDHSSANVECNEGSSASSRFCGATHTATSVGWFRTKRVHIQLAKLCTTFPTYKRRTHRAHFLAVSVGVTLVLHRVSPYFAYRSPPEHLQVSEWQRLFKVNIHSCF